MFLKISPLHRSSKYLIDISNNCYQCYIKNLFLWLPLLEQYLCPTELHRSYIDIQDSILERETDWSFDLWFKTDCIKLLILLFYIDGLHIRFQNQCFSKLMYINFRYTARLKWQNIIEKWHCFAVILHFISANNTAYSTPPSHTRVKSSIKVEKASNIEERRPFLWSHCCRLGGLHKLKFLFKRYFACVLFSSCTTLRSNLFFNLNRRLVIDLFSWTVGLRQTFSHLWLKWET